MFASITARRYSEYMKAISRQPGLGAIELLLAIVTIVLVGLVGWLGYQRLMVIRPSSGTTKSDKVMGSADTYSGWKTYTNVDGGVTFKYPANWSSNVAQEIKYSDGSFGGVSGALTSPSGHKLAWVYNVIGGKDGPGCTPPATDTPFAQGDTCDSKQILSVEQIPSVGPAKGASPSLFEDRLYITETKYEQGTFMGGKSSPVTYQICLDPYFNDEADLFPKVGTKMGFELPCNYWSTGFNVEFFANSQADLSSPDAQTAQLVMRSFGTI